MSGGYVPCFDYACREADVDPSRPFWPRYRVRAWRRPNEDGAVRYIPVRVLLATEGLGRLFYGSDEVRRITAARDAAQLRAQIPSSTDPDRLERMARAIEAG